MQYLSNTTAQKKEMLRAIGVSSFEELLGRIPPALRKFKWDLPQGMSEPELLGALVETGRKNRHFHDAACYLGAGTYDHYVPAAVGALAHRGEFITSYTPYQGEASQGTLQSIFEFQSLICEITAMDFSNASMYDGASALAEAALLAIRHTGRRRILVPESVHPEYRTVLKTYVSCLDAAVDTVSLKEGAVDPEDLRKKLTADTAAVVVGHPNFFGILEDARALSDAAHRAGALLIACVNPVSLGILEPPGAYGADIAVGEGQPLGNPVSFGGPHFGFFTVQKDLLRKIPGRLAGMTADRAGRRSFVLTLQAREQHIRREKATSNICTNHSLCALKAAIYLSLLGPVGFKKLALLNFNKAHQTYDRLLKIPGVRPFSTKPFFNEFALTLDKDPQALRRSLQSHRILGPLNLKRFDARLERTYLFAVTENRTDADLRRLAQAVEQA